MMIMNSIYPSKSKDYNWWVGYEVPTEILNSRIVTMQVDGHELELILQAMQKTSER